MSLSLYVCCCQCVIISSSSDITAPDKIYVCGGLNHDWNQHFSECGIYSPETDSWSSMASLPKGVHHTAAGTDGSKFYVFGGRENGNYLSDGMPYVQVWLVKCLICILAYI